MSAQLIFQTALSTIAVMLTVTAIIFVVIGVGLLTTNWWGGQTSVKIRSALWLGWFWVAVYVSVAHLFFAMQPPVAIPVFVASTIGWLLLVRSLVKAKSQSPGRGQSVVRTAQKRPPWQYLVWALALGLFGLLSNQVLRAPIYHSDAGIYRIPYALLTNEYPEIPGVANLNPEFGFGHITDTISGLLAGFLQQNEGYRFINIVFFISLLFEILLRVGLNHLQSKQLLKTPNIFFLLSLISLLLINPWTSIWIATPTVDLPTAIFFLVAIGYFIDALTSGRFLLFYPGLAALLIASVLRQANAILLVALFVVVILWIKANNPRGRLTSAKKSSAFVLLGVYALGSLILIASILSRALVRTGFPLYPVSSLGGISADWKMLEDAGETARDKLQTLSIAWTVSEPSQLETVSSSTVLLALLREPVVQITTLMLGIAVFIMLRYRGFQEFRNLSRPPLLYLFPLWIGCGVIVIAAAWLARDPRYFWGPLLALGLVPISVALSGIARHSSRAYAPSGRVSLLILAVGFLIIFLQKGYLGSSLISLAPATGLGVFQAEGVPDAIGGLVETESGLKVFAVTETPHCYSQSPPCSYTVDPRLELRGETLREGFRIRQ